MLKITPTNLGCNTANYCVMNSKSIVPFALYLNSEPKRVIVKKSRNVTPTSVNEDLGHYRLLFRVFDSQPKGSGFEPQRPVCNL